MVQQSKAEAVASMLSNKGVTVSIAEGDTAGYFGQLLADTPGSSAFFYGGILAYAKYVQQHLLGISNELLDAEGSVSTMVSLAMAQRVRELCGSDIGISLTGIAGPTGGSKKKPIGLYYISLTSHEGFSSCRRFLFKKQSRQQNRRQAAQEALRVLHEYIG